METDKDNEFSDKEALAKAIRAIDQTEEFDRIKKQIDRDARHAHDAGGESLHDEYRRRDAERKAMINQFAKEKAALGKELTELISDFELRWHMVLVKTSCQVLPRDEADPNSLPVTRNFMCDFGC